VDSRSIRFSIGIHDRFLSPFLPLSAKPALNSYFLSFAPHSRQKDKKNQKSYACSAIISLPLPSPDLDGFDRLDRFSAGRISDLTKMRIVDWKFRPRRHVDKRAGGASPKARDRYHAFGILSGQMTAVCFSLLERFVWSGYDYSVSWNRLHLRQSRNSRRLL